MVRRAFSTVAIFQILAVFESRFFAYNTLKMLLVDFLACFREFKILIQNDNFAKAIAFALWPILAMMEKLPFFEY